MNEEDLKNIWQTDYSAPTIDFSALKNSFNDWHDKLRRKIRIDIAAQIVSVAIVLILVLFHQKLFFMFWFAVAVGIWYVRKILVFYRLEKHFAGDAKLFLSEKLRMMKSFINQARLILYAAPLFLIPGAFYAFGYFNGAATSRELLYSVLFTVAIGEITAIVLMEIYFKIFYGSAIAKLKDLLRQLNFDE